MKYSIKNYRGGFNLGKKIVVALGGNALGNSVKEQLELVSVAAKSIVDLIETGNDIIVTHGNGPQVGMINKGLNYAYEMGQIETEVPFPESSALSIGYIGYHLQNAIQNELRKRGVRKNAATVVTQVLVDKDDPGFTKPTKPIGSFLSKEDAEVISAEKGYTFVEDSGRGYRRVIASPKPIDIIELETIKTLSNNGNVVIACGGGGIPVVESNTSLIGIDAVIDKDLTSSLLARLLDADIFMVLTAVDNVAINFNKPNMINLEKVGLSELSKYLDEGHFAKGSMLPKVLAAIDFVVNGCGKEAIITSLENSAKAITENKGTRVYNDTSC